MIYYHLRHFKSLAILIFVFLFASGEILHAENKQSMHGVICDGTDNRPIAFATVSLHHQSDSALITGTTSNQEGYFEISKVKRGDYLLRISFMGYRTCMVAIELDYEENSDLGTFSLIEESIQMEETLVVGERIKAKSTENGTNFFMNKKIYNSSNSGVDILKHLPGVRVDLMQNISLEGNTNIKILVDGKERDLQYLEQIDAKQVDKVEIIRNPGVRYDANISGVIHIILKRREVGMSGHIFSEIPTNKKEVYVHPSCGINYNNRKLHLYAAYAGEVGNFDVTKQNTKLLNTRQGVQSFQSSMDVRQKNWKHRISLGADYHLDKRNQLSLYAFLSPHDQSFEGVSEMKLRTDDSIDLVEKGESLEKDNYLLTHYSLYYKHLFAKEGSELSFDLNYFRLIGEKSIWYDHHDDGSMNGVKPQNQFIGFRMDYHSAFGTNLKMQAGWKSQLRSMEDRIAMGFNYQEDVHAAYLELSYLKNSMTVSIGMRCEYSSTGLEKEKKRDEISFLPALQLGWQLSRKQRLQINYRRSITRPHVYQLSPVVTRIDPVHIKRGNPGLLPAFHHHISLDHSISLGKNQISTQLYQLISNDHIQHYGLINEEQLLESKIANLSNRKEYGVKISAAVSLSKSIGLTPYLKIFQNSESPNQLARVLEIAGKNKTGYEFGCSSRVNFTNEFSASFIFQYNSPFSDLQNRRYSNAIYILSVDRVFKNGMKLGISSAIPLKKDFTYSAIRSKGKDYDLNTKEKVHVSNFFVRLQASYQFKWGKQRANIERQNRIEEGKKSNGF